MSQRAAAISLKIPDNEAYTALTALRRLGVNAERVERSEIWCVDDHGDPDDFAQRMERNETIFNPNKHRLTVLERSTPRPGEVWICEIGAHDEVREHLGGKTIAGITQARRYVGWRLLDAHAQPVSHDVLAAATERLLCNPAIEKATF